MKSNNAEEDVEDSMFGRRSRAMAATLRNLIARGVYAQGAFLPPVRELSARHGINKKTVQNAMKILQNSSLVTVVPRRGFRVIKGVRPGDRQARPLIAFVSREGEQPNTWIPGNIILPALRDSAERHHCSLLVLSCLNRTVEDIIHELRSMSVTGVLIGNDRFAGAICEAGFNAVSISHWDPTLHLDSVSQDSQMGGMIAADYLLAKGCRHFGWCGPASHSIHTFERLGGFAAQLEKAGKSIPPAAMFRRDTPTVDDAAAWLSRHPELDAIAAPWFRHSCAIVAAAKKLGRQPGRTLHIVGWRPDAIMDTSPQSAGNRNSFPFITWSPELLCKVAISRILQRSSDPELEPVRIKIPVALSTAAIQLQGT